MHFHNATIGKIRKKILSQQLVEIKLVGKTIDSFKYTSDVINIDLKCQVNGLP